MSISSDIKIKHNELPDCPGVYFYYDKNNKLLYVGKATSLKRRVGSYFTKAHDNRIAEMVSRIARIDYRETKTVIEALVLEANEVKRLRPYYNILLRDDKSFLYLVITNSVYPRPELMRGHDLSQLGIDPFAKNLSEEAKKKFLRVFGPYTSSRSLKMALDLIRKAIPWSTCKPPEETGKSRACFYVHLKKCPGVCTGAISKTDYRKIMRQLILFFEGKKHRLTSEFEKDMLRAAKEERFEDAVFLRQKLMALEHIQDIALLSKEDTVFVPPRLTGGIPLHGRIEGYDISTISGTSSVGSMVVFEQGKPAKQEYRKFKIRTLAGPNDVGMMEEMLRRRLQRAQTHPQTWPLPDLMVIDGGEGQVGRVQELLDAFGFSVPIIGIAKGPDRKQDRLVFNRKNPELVTAAKRGKELFQRVRDEAHRFAVRYHRILRKKHFLQ